MQSFDVPLSLDTLRWLAQGQWPSRLERAVRLWELLHRLYHPEFPWRDQLKEIFDYTEVRDLMLSPQHPRQDPPKEQAIVCPDPDCLCHRPLNVWVLDPGWLQGLGLSSRDINRQLKNPPLAIAIAPCARISPTWPNRAGSKR
ncbi:MAG: hypothetical protein HC924_19710 [Synechococcaceae cyanobacterium SM2_3_2]|nr:hypothetical protein [Synechococcaceae cyanobacterium SM2_3_2]